MRELNCTLQVVHYTSSFIVLFWVLLAKDIGPQPHNCRKQVISLHFPLKIQLGSKSLGKMDNL